MAKILENRYKLVYDIKNKLTTVVRYKQGDADTSIMEITLMDGEKVIDITGETIEFHFQRKDGTIVYQDYNSGIVILDAINGVVQATLKSNTLAVPGIVRCEILRTKDNKHLTTSAFNFVVESSMDGGVSSTNYISRIEDRLIIMATEIETARFGEVDLSTKIGKLDASLADMTKHMNYLNVCASSNIYNLDLSKSYNFEIETTDTNTKTISFGNTPIIANMILSISVYLKFTNDAIVMFPTGTAWRSEVSPIFFTGMKYILYFKSYDNGITWLAAYTGEW